MRRVARDNGLSLAFGALFLAALIGEALVGHADFNHQQAAHQQDAVSLLQYLTSSAFAVDVMENWQSEYLQFALYVFATIWLVQRGSTESKAVDEGGAGSDRSPRRGFVRENSLVLTMAAIFLASWAATAVAGRVSYNAEQLDHREAVVTIWQYLGSSDFWNRTLQNWQSEFLAVGSFVVLSIYLRQRGSPESKPVAAPNEGGTGSEAT